MSHDYSNELKVEAYDYFFLNAYDYLMRIVPIKFFFLIIIIGPTVAGVAILVATEGSGRPATAFLGQIWPSAPWASNELSFASHGTCT